jgi:hypothetical protein
VVADVSMDHITFVLLDLEDMTVSSFETFGTIRPKTHCHMSEILNRQLHCCWNLESYTILKVQ